MNSHATDVRLYMRGWRSSIDQSWSDGSVALTACCPEALREPQRGRGKHSCEAPMFSVSLCAINNSDPETAFFVLHRAWIECCLFSKSRLSDACIKYKIVLFCSMLFFLLEFFVGLCLLHDVQILYTDFQILSLEVVTSWKFSSIENSALDCVSQSVWIGKKFAAYFRPPCIVRRAALLTLSLVSSSSCSRRSCFASSSVAPTSIRSGSICWIRTRIHSWLCTQSTNRSVSQRINHTNFLTEYIEWAKK